MKIYGKSVLMALLTTSCVWADADMAKLQTQAIAGDLPSVRRLLVYYSRQEIDPIRASFWAVTLGDSEQDEDKLTAAEALVDGSANEYAAAKRIVEGVRNKDAFRTRVARLERWIVAYGRANRAAAVAFARSFGGDKAPDKPESTMANPVGSEKANSGKEAGGRK